jgi:hypothetical protein
MIILIINYTQLFSIQKHVFTPENPKIDKHDT